MNKDIIKGQWKQIRGEVKKQWGKFTDNDLDQIEGDYDKAVGMLQERYGYGKEQAEREANTFFQKYH